MLDIVILTPWFPNRPDGWPARFISDSALALARKGHKVRVGAVRGFIPPGMSRWAPAEHQGRIDVAAFEGIETIHERRHFALPKGVLRGIKNRSLDLVVRQLLAQFVAERRPDVVLVHTETISPGAVDAAHSLGLPVAVSLHGVNTNELYLTAGGQKERFLAALSQADSVIVVGSPLVPYAARIAGRDDHIEVVWNGVESPAKMRAVPTPDEERVELITVANLQEGKGIDLLLSALERLDREGMTNWRLRIIGDGPMGADLYKMAVHMGLGKKVLFLGVRTNSQVFEELAHADVFVLPSYREAFGVAYLEAMASGLLTIGVAGQGPSQFIADHKTGLLIEPRSADAIVSALRPLLAGERAEWRKIAAQGAVFVRREMTWDAHARRLTDLMTRLRAAVLTPPDGSV